MRFSVLGSLLLGVSGYVSANPVSNLNSLGDYEASGLMKRTGGCPGLPKNADPNLLHVVRRLDKSKGREFVGNNGVTMDNLKKLLADMNGRHVDVLVGNSRECKSFDLAFADRTWLDHQDGDGAPIQAREREYRDLGKDQDVEYKGHLPAGTTYAKVLSELQHVIKEYGVYNHKSKNCDTAAAKLIANLRPSTTPTNSPPPSPKRPSSPSSPKKPSSPPKGSKPKN